MSPEDIETISVCNIETSHSEGERNSMSDNKLFPISKNNRCSTCNENQIKCPGHYGHINLAYPMLNYGYIHMLLKTLRCVCFECYKIVSEISETELSLYKEDNKRFEYIHDICKKKAESACFHCDTYKSQLIKTKDLNIMSVPEGKKINIEMEDTIVDTEEIYNVLKRITDEDIIKMGYHPVYARPEWMLFQKLPIPPQVIRPKVIMDANKGADDLDSLYDKIIKANNKLINELDKNNYTESVMKPQIYILQKLIYQLINNNITGLDQIKHRSNRPLKTYTDRLKGKEARLRGNLMGKRVNFSSRTVVGPDPTLDIDEVGIPIYIAKILTFPENVNQYNIKVLTEYLENGPNKYPGAHFLIKKNGKKFDLKYCKDPVLEIGDTLERHLINGDYVVFNRQPSLHRMSLMGHKVKIMKHGSTFRINLCATTPYNADFDGDECNVHVPQTLTGKAEVEHLMSVPTQIISPQGSKPIIGLVQDSLLAIYLITQDSVFITRTIFFDTIMKMKYFTKNVPKPNSKGLFTGKQAVSLVIPKSFNYIYNDVIIKDGNLIKGILNKKLVGNSGILIQALVNDYGHKTTANFLSDLVRVVDYWLLNRSYSIGLKDCLISKKAKNEIQNLVIEAEDKVDKLIENKEVRLENKILKVLNDVTQDTGKLVQKSVENTQNNIDIMVNSGSKGSTVNIAQIMGLVGQQNLTGKRIPSQFNNRTLTCYEEYDCRPESKGFVKHSYIDGLTAQDFFFHTMGGREGLIDTAIKTAETGYLQRRLVKMHENIKIHYDKTVRDCNDIVQFKYGGNNIDPLNMEKQKINLCYLDETEFIDRYKGSNIEEFEVLKENRAMLKYTLKESFEFVYMPVNMERLILKYNNNKESTDLLEDECFRLVKEFIESNIIDEHQYVFKALIWSYFASKLVVHKYRLSKSELLWCLDNIILKYNASKVDAGESVGIIASQSIGEVTMQLTLNSFHASGLDTKMVTVGVPRLNEILNCTKSDKLKAQSLDVYLESGDEYTPMIELLTKIKYIDFNYIIKSKNVVRGNIFDKYNLFKEIPHENYTLWIEIDKYKLFEIKYTMEDLYEKLSENLPNHLIIRWTEINNDEIFITFTLNMEDDNDIDNNDDSTDEQCLHKLFQVIKNISIRGIPNITNVYVPPPKINKYTNKREYVLETDGTDLLNILNIDNVDATRTISNDIFEINNVLGIEAAREAILIEIRKVLSHGSYVNYHHISIICDVMTRLGYLNPMSRHGMKCTNASVFNKATFEEAVDRLYDSSRFFKEENIDTLSESIIFGQISSLGTGSCDIIYNQTPTYEYKDPLI